MDTLWGHFYDSVLRPVLDRLFDEVHGPLLWAALWATGTLAVVAATDGTDAIWQPWPLAVAGGGALLAFGAGLAWTSRIQPLVLVAPFLAATDSAAEEAQAAHTRVLDALRQAAERLGEEPRWAVDVFERSVDPGSAAAALRRTKSRRSPVLIAGKVGRDSAGLTFEVRILTPRRQLQWRPDAATSTRVSIPTPHLEEHLDRSRQALVDQATATALLALGVALLLRGERERARAVLTAHPAPSALMLFYAALAAWQDDRTQESETLAERSWQLAPFAPTAALAAVVGFSSGREENARAWRERLTSAPAPGPHWAPFIHRLDELAVGYFAADTLDQTTAQLEDIDRRAERQKDELTAQHAAENAARDLVREGQDEAALQVLESSPGQLPLRGRVLHALLSARTGRPDAAARAADLERDLEHADAPEHHWERLALAYAALEDPTSFARAWRRALHAGAAEFGLAHAQQMAVMMPHLHSSADIPPAFWDHPDVADVLAEFAAPEDDDEQEEDPPGSGPPPA